MPHSMWADPGAAAFCYGSACSFERTNLWKKWPPSRWCLAITTWTFAGGGVFAKQCPATTEESPCLQSCMRILSTNAGATTRRDFGPELAKCKALSTLRSLHSASHTPRNPLAAAGRVPFSVVSRLVGPAALDVRRLDSNIFGTVRNL